MPAHGIFNHFIILGAEEQDPDAGVFVRTLDPQGRC